ncbi:protein GRAVITROPIC IN THE LIGHT 1-like [Phragmites australis]|uniref:protein GRAVITROPIC IN THE LIGHT 1-like n=1 Tax=Phragmites australis TaxID=29695 RepID=UPI002D799B36|nr:protein GRAVITROPIC IN THE LIGHT 1-like [Phragmites australis]
MEMTMAAAPMQPKTGGLARRLARLLRRKRSPAGTGMAYSVAGDEFDESLDSSINSLSKLKLSGNLAAAYSLDAYFKNATEKNGAAPQLCSAPAPDAAKHAFVASLFAGASAVKAAYAQLQLAQHPYDAEAIQAADAGLVSELTKLSDLKRRYTRDPVAAAKNAAALAAHADEQHHLLRTYEITAGKLEAELRVRDAYAERARAALAHELHAARALEERVHPGRTLAALDDLHLSGLNATHFVTALRHTVKSIRSFAKAMLDAMRPAGWDPAVATAAVHPAAQLSHPGDAKFALESYVALKMFTNFHRRDFGLSSLHNRGSHDRRRFFEEFSELKVAPAASFVDTSNPRWGALGEFLRDRYLSLVHERMETSFFGLPEQRAAVSAGDAFPRTAWFAEFAEMGRRVWLLHCLFSAFDGDASIFQVRARSRFSEVYMDSVSDVDGAADSGGTAPSPAGHLAVGFTVVPGFKVGGTVIQCRVYLSRPDRLP